MFFEQKSLYLYITDFINVVHIELLAALLTIVAIIFPTKSVYKRLKRVQERRRRARQVEKEIVARIMNIDKNVTSLKKDVTKIIAVQNCDLKLDEVAILDFDGGGNCVDINLATTLLFGADRDSFLGKGFLQHIHNGDRIKAHDDWEEIVETGTDVSYKYRIINEITREVIPCNFRTVIYRDNTGKPIHIRVNIKPIIKN